MRKLASLPRLNEPKKWNSSTEERTLARRGCRAKTHLPVQDVPLESANFATPGPATIYERGYCRGEAVNSRVVFLALP
jgi:hypothetical protein